MTITSMDPFEIWARHYPDDEDPPGTEPGEECGRWHEADEDAPRGVRAIRCTGTMIEDADGEDTVVICDSCGELA